MELAGLRLIAMFFAGPVAALIFALNVLAGIILTVAGLIVMFFSVYAVKGGLFSSVILIAPLIP